MEKEEVKQVGKRAKSLKKSARKWKRKKTVKKAKNLEKTWKKWKTNEIKCKKCYKRGKILKNCKQVDKKCEKIERVFEKKEKN